MADERPAEEQSRRRSTNLTDPSQRGLLRGMFERIVLTWRLFWDERVSLAAKLIPLATAAYVVSPVDFLPAAVFSVFGVVDDVGVIILGLNAFIWVCPPEIVQEHLRALGAAFTPRRQNNEDVVDGSAEDADR